MDTFLIIDVTAKKKTPKSYEQIRPAPKYDNPGQIRDREFYKELKAHKKGQVFRPASLPVKWNDRYKKPFHPSWENYCSRHICNDYHRTVCGLNRDTMRFKWFQSGCHIALNNVCNHISGDLKYDIVDNRNCLKYVYLRSSCPTDCNDLQMPVCAISKFDNHVVAFKNFCYLEKANCKSSSYQEYDETDMDLCRNTLLFYYQANIQ